MCSEYNQLRYQFYTNSNGLFTLYTNFDYNDDEFKLTVLTSNEYFKSTAKFKMQKYVYYGINDH